MPLEIFEQGAQTLGPHLAQALVDDGVGEVVAPLLRYSLVERDVEARTLSVHRMVQAVVRAGLGEAEREWGERVVKALARLWPQEPVFGTWKLGERLCPQTLVVARVVDEMGIEDVEVGFVLNQAGYYAWQRGRRRPAEWRLRGGFRDAHLSAALNLAIPACFQDALKAADPLLEDFVEVGFGHL